MQPGYQPGARLHIQSIATELGVSKTSVVFGINQLVTLGLVLVRPRSGTFVVNLDHDEVSELFQLVAQLELAAIRLVTWPCSESGLIEINHQINEAKTSMKSGELATFLDASHMLRIALVGLSKNKKMVEIYTTTALQTYLAKAYIALVPGRAEAEVERQLTLVDLLKSAEPARLEQEIVDYWDCNWDYYLKARNIDSLQVPQTSGKLKEESLHHLTACDIGGQFCFAKEWHIQIGHVKEVLFSLMMFP